MKLIKYITFSIVLLSVTYSCNKEKTEIITPPVEEEPFCFEPCDTAASKLEVLWRKPLHPDTLRRISTEPIVVNGKVIFTLWPDTGEKETITAYKIENGNIEWNRESSSNGKTSTRNSLLKYNKNILLSAGKSDVCLLDGDSGEDIWCYHPNQYNQKSGTTAKIIGDSYYREHRVGGLETDVSYLMKGNLEDGSLETIFTSTKANNFAPFLAFPNAWKSPSDVNYLFFQDHTYNWDTNDYETDLIMFNDDTQEEEYRWNNFTLSFSSFHAPHIWNDKIITYGNDTTYCIDIATKEFLWETYTKGNTTSNFIIEKDVLVVNLLDRTIMGINPHNGEVIWKETDSGSTCSNMVYHDGLVYFGSVGRGKLYAVDVETGEHVWEEKSPFKDEFSNAAFLNGVAIDPVNKVLFTDDAYYVMAVKLPER